MTPEMPAFGEQDRCPHCNGLTVVREDEELWWVCGICGGPRIPLTKGDEITVDSKRSLKRSNDRRVSSAMWKYASWAGFFLAALGIGLGVVLFPASILTAIIPAALGVILAVLALSWRSKSGKLTKEATEAWERAWDLQIDHLVHHSKSMSAKQIARKMKVPDEAIEKIVARLSASDRVRVDVGDDAQLRVSTTEIHSEDHEHEDEHEHEHGHDEKKA